MLRCYRQLSPVLANRWIYMLVGSVLLSGSGCVDPHLSPSTGDATEETPPEIEAAVLTLAPQPWPTIVRTQGSLVADEVTTVGAKVAGRVVQVHVDLGDVVREGESLVALDQQEFQLQVAQAEAQLRQARAAVGLRPEDDATQLDPHNAPPVREAQAVWDEARTKVERLRELRERNATSDVELEAAAAADRVAEARHASALNSVHEKLALIAVQTAERDLAQQRLRDAITPAPFDGEVQSRTVAPGTYVQVGQPLVSLVRTGTLRFRASMPERYAQQLAIGQRIVLHVESIQQPYELEVSRISPALDEVTRSLVFEANVENTDGQLRAGLFGEAEVMLDSQAEALVVPPSAVVEFAGAEKVWKVVDSVASEQPVLVGRRTESGLEILRGLTAGDRVLLDGSKGRLARVAALPRGP
jgi:RND family efflux transporter MFP subunit